MNAPETIKPINVAHEALLNSEDALCVDAVATATGLKKRDAAKQLKELAGLGMIEPEFRAGGVPFYRLIAAPASEINDVAEVGDTDVVELGDSEGGKADAPADFATTPELQYLAPEDYADMPPADPDFLAQANRALGEQLDAANNLVTARGHTITSLRYEVSDLRARLDAVTQQSIADTDAMTERLTTTRAALDEAFKEIERLRAELATERQAREALQEQAGNVCFPSGYLVCATKRKPRRINDGERAKFAALAAVRAGAARAEVLAVVPVGAARRGAEWRAK